jgi:N-acetylglucosamine kinase-like BadF-type ATPase
MSIPPSQASPLFIGIDGGGTHTRAALVRGDGSVIGVGIGGPSNFQTDGIETARESVREAVARAWERSGEGRMKADGVFLGMAGVASRRDRETVEEIAASLAIAGRVEADHDIRTALAGGLAGAPGIALIAGTGSAAYGRNREGEAWRSGGWGHLLDDLGGGYWIGVQGMIAIARAADGRAEATALTGPLMDALGITMIDDLLRLAGNELLPRATIATFAPLVIEAARGGDPVATDILKQGADELALMVAAVRSHLLLPDDAAIVMTGGLTADPHYAPMIANAITRCIPGARIPPPSLPPLLGAALLAMTSAGIDPGEETIARMITTYRDTIKSPLPPF